MPSFREKLLTEVTSICQQLYERRLALVKTQARVSEKSKQDIILMILRLNKLRAIDPFPAEYDVDTSPLDKLKVDIAAAEGDQFAIQEELMTWATAFHPTVGTDTYAAVRISPINQRMIDALATFRSTIDRTRMNLMLAGDPADLDAYTSARNAFTLARSVYDERLKLDQVSATNPACAEMEQVLILAVRDASGATFPGAIQAGADFISSKLFV
jgi:hypothetical protein